jgi:hypothetical protein
MLSSTRRAKRRSSSRASPGAPRQTWYCSVSLAKKRRPRGLGVGRRGQRGRAAAERSMPARSTSSTSASWSTEPAAATTTLVGT